MRNFVLFAATAGGTGLLPKAPGTWSSLFAAGLWLLLAPQLGLQAGLVIAVLLLGFWCCGPAGKHFGIQDDPRITVDEVAGQWLALLWLPVQLGSVVLGFVLFRLFDILKPPPVRQLEAIPGAPGVMLDDVAAGLLANAIGQLTWRWLVPTLSGGAYA